MFTCLNYSIIRNISKRSIGLDKSLDSIFPLNRCQIINCIDNLEIGFIVSLFVEIFEEKKVPL